MSVVASPAQPDPTPLPGTAGSTTAAATERFLESRTAATTRAGYAETLTAITGPDDPVAALTPEQYAAVMDRWKAAAAATWNRHLSAPGLLHHLGPTPGTAGHQPRPALRERVLWRLRYDTAARAEEILTLNVEGLGLEFRRARVTSKGARNWRPRVIKCRVFTRSGAVKVTWRSG
ncbi:hypothetical protein FHU36_004230 [Nonomuraea muscovyensis]|uniref:Uncharacterized protein n=1 Tax=Nonomuraea muscovyensis TaxID=1124761 RepID=A0A7X0C584_9ACTN|nr:site-specific integrase [Nonomuraea muscovyensis]MBB6347685.1 hypothetical protein [Nonomuraea muscovyensis]